MVAEWTYVLDITFLSLFLALATYLKRSIKVFQRFLVPNSIIAGFIGLVAGSEVLGIINLDTQRLENIIYHLMAVGFIALALKERNRKKNREITNSGIFIVSTYLIQGIIGFSISLILSFTLFPDLFPSFGLLLPLGYGQGPGQASSIGSQWEQLGFSHGGNIGLSIAAFGFIWACLGGIPLVNYLVRRRKLQPEKSKNFVPKQMLHEEDKPDDEHLSESIDKISIQLFLIGIVYLATYLTLQGVSMLLNNMGTFGQTFSKLLWGFNFIIGAVYALCMRSILDFLKAKKVMVRSYASNYLLQRISGGSFDFMVTASIAAISVAVLKEYLIPTVLITSLGGLITIFYINFMCKKIFKVHLLENIVAFYGMLTGTISTGLALLREVDPEFNSGAARNLVLGSGVGMFLGFPLMLLLNVPIMGYVNNQPIFYLYALIGLLAYFVVLMVLLRLNNRKR